MARLLSRLTPCWSWRELALITVIAATAIVADAAIDGTGELFPIAAVVVLAPLVQHLHGRFVAEDADDCCEEC